MKLADDKAKIKTFHIVKYKTPQGNETCQALVTHLSECGEKVYVLLFDMENGTYVKSTSIL